MNKFWGNIFKSRHQGLSRIDDILLKIPIFQDLKRREIGKIKSILHHREYRKDEVIFRQGDIGLGMYIIENGVVEITCENEHNILAELGEGDFFGELALLEDSQRTATATAKTPCTLLCFFKPELLNIISREPRIGSKILFRLAWTIGERLKSTNEQLNTLTCLTRRDQSQNP